MDSHFKKDKITLHSKNILTLKLPMVYRWIVIFQGKWPREKYERDADMHNIISTPQSSWWCLQVWSTLQHNVYPSSSGILTERHQRLWKSLLLNEERRQLWDIFLFSKVLYAWRSLCHSLADFEASFTMCYIMIGIVDGFCVQGRKISTQDLATFCIIYASSLPETGTELLTKLIR